MISSGKELPIRGDMERMTEKEQKRASKFLSLVLRHKPQVIGLTLDQNGWAETAELLEKMKRNGRGLSVEQIKEVVANNDKKRFAFSPDFKRIRANQGHSLQVDLDLKEKAPPEWLYHGTTERNLDSIIEKGILKGKRHHVHLSPDEATAKKVGSRHGKPVVLPVEAGAMHQQGIKFYLSENGVWLTEHVAAEYIRNLQ